MESTIESMPSTRNRLYVRTRTLCWVPVPSGSGRASCARVDRYGFRLLYKRQRPASFLDGMPCDDNE